MVNKKMYAMLLTELLGTALLTLVFLSVKSSAIGIGYFIALGIGLAYAGLILFANYEEKEADTKWIPQFNPALSVALWTVKKIKTVELLLNVVMQFLGAYASYALFIYLINNKIPNSAAHYSTRAFVAEAVGTFIFVLIVSATAYKKFSAPVAATVGGAAYAIGIVVASSASNALINPAVALGVNSFSWAVYTLAPVVGGVIAINLYSLLYVDKISSGKKTKSKK